MNWIETERRAVVNVVMNIQFQKCGEVLDCLRTCWLLQKHSAAWHCIETTVQTVRRQKAIPYRPDSRALLLPDLHHCSFSQHFALQSALLRHIKPMTLSVSRSHKHRPSLHESRTVTSLAFHCEGLWSTLPVASCRSRGAATAVPTVCSEQASMLHHISAFTFYVYVFLLSVAVGSRYKQ
jgi:hypothetical protein